MAVQSDWGLQKQRIEAYLALKKELKTLKDGKVNEFYHALYIIEQNEKLATP
jgi:hypothetical protein